MRSNDMRAASGCEIVDRIRAKTRFHSVWDLLELIRQFGWRVSSVE